MLAIRLELVIIFAAIHCLTTLRCATYNISCDCAVVPPLPVWPSSALAIEFSLVWLIGCIGIALRIPGKLACEAAAAFM